jgi:hypothetical protein
LVLLFRHGDMAYFMFERGAIDEERLRSAMGPLPVASDVAREFWTANRDFFADGYRAYVDDLFRQAGATGP